MCAHLVLRCHGWPADVVFEPAEQMEDAIEYYFGHLKTGNLNQGRAGGITLANGILNAQLIHMRQQRSTSKAICDSCIWGVGDYSPTPQIDF